MEIYPSDTIKDMKFVHTYIFEDPVDDTESIYDMFNLSYTQYYIRFTPNYIEYHSIIDEHSSPYHIWRIPLKRNKFNRRIAEITHPIMTYENDILVEVHEGIWGGGFAIL